MATWRSSGSGGGTAPNEWSCRYHELTIAAGIQTLPAVDYDSAPVLEQGRPYVLTCRVGAVIVYEDLIVWDPADPFSGVAAEDRLADEALASLELPLPVPAASPPLGAEQLVGFEAWLWLDAWAPVTATASLGGVAATVEAVPARVRWDTGDGTVVTCEGPGEVWRPDHPGTGACRHVWTQDSSGQPGGMVDVTVTVEWHVTWRATTGVAGDLGTLTSSTGAAVRVVEAQAVIDY